MSEHIKIGLWIKDDIVNCKEDIAILNQKKKAEWVSLSWLKEQIEKKCYDDTVMPKFTEPERWIRVSTLLSLLEES
jgi:hypothetical protein